MSVGDAIAVSLGNTVSNAVGTVLEALNCRLLLVGINVELDEQEQIAGQNTTSKQGGCLSASAVSHVRPAHALSGVSRVGYKSPSVTSEANRLTDITHCRSRPQTDQ